MVNPELQQYGFSCVHAWIRATEFILHIAYRLDLPVKCWRVTSTVDKARVARTKKRIQSDLRKQIGVIVDKPLPGGRGTTTDGNTARRLMSSDIF